MFVWNNKHLIIDWTFLYIGVLFTNDNQPVPFKQLVAKGIDFSIYLTWRGITGAMKSNYKEPKHLAKENFSDNKFEVEVN